MGQRHQLFVIARVGLHYRSLAAVHHQWLWSLSALHQCLELLHIFSDNANRLILQQELAFAADFYRNQAPPMAEPPKISWDDPSYSKPCRFPFITTCLMVGAAYNRHSASVTAVSEEPFGMGYSQGDNNDGITVLDITDLSNVKYCFVNFLGIDYLERGAHDDDDDDELGDLEGKESRQLQKKLHQPLSGWEYLLTYHRRSDNEVQKNRFIPETLGKYPLVDIGALSGTWPWGAWGVDRASMRRPPISVEHQPRATVSLAELSLAKLTEAALSDSNFDPTVVDDSIKNIPQFRQRLQRQLIIKADQVGPSPASVALLRLAYAGEQTLDWSRFINLGTETLKSALASKELTAATSVNISGTAAMQSPKDLADALSVMRELQRVYLFDRPDRETDDTGIRTLLQIAALHPHLIKDKILLSAPFSRAIRGTSWLPTTTEIPVLLSAFPVLQLLVSHGAARGYDRNLPLEYFYLGDAFLGPERLVTGLFQYIETLISGGPGLRRTGIEVAYCYAAASASLGNFDSIEVGSLPAETYTMAKTSYHTPKTGLCSKMRDLLPGQWTILLSQHYFQDEDDEDEMPSGTAFKYAFVRSRFAIQLGHANEVPQINTDELEVVNFAGFLQQTAPQVDVGKLEQHFDKLVDRVESTYGYADDETLTFLGPEDAGNLLTQCILASRV